MRSLQRVGRIPRRLLHECRELKRVIELSRSFSSPPRCVFAHLLQRLRLDLKLVYTYEGARFRLYNNAVSSQMFYNATQWHGTADIHFLKQLLRPGETFVDIGANVGSHTIAIAKHFECGVQVHAFEAHPRTLQYLQENVALNALDCVRIYNVALGDKAGEVEFLDESGVDDINRVITSGEIQHRTVCVPMRRLDDFELYKLPIGVIKIDVEGYEWFVLQGAERTVAQAQFLYLEASDQHYARYGYSTGELIALLSSWGWELYRFLQPSVLERVSDDTPRIMEREWENWVATRSLQTLLQRVPYQVVER